MLSNAVKTYEDVDKNTSSGRATEARVLTQGALKLIEVKQKWNSPQRRQLLDAALRYNQRIWSIFQVELSQKNHPLPEQVRLDLLQLSRFIDRRIFDAMAFPEAEKLDIIIKINQNIAAGLRGSPR